MYAAGVETPKSPDWSTLPQTSREAAIRTGFHRQLSYSQGLQIQLRNANSVFE